MARKKQYNYFEAMKHLAENSYQAAEHLENIINNYNLEELAAKSEAIHHLEKESDQVIDELTNQLYDAFITPIDREDILIIAEYLDNILDGINAMTYTFENLVITELRADTATFTALIRKATKGVLIAIQEFPKFKNSKTLKQMISDVNQIESEGDQLYSSLKKKLFSEEQNILEIVKWKEVYDLFEVIINDTEHAVDAIDGLIIKNT
jgi:Phosphate transport regulator (distant homolog of PhoU)